MPALGFLPAQVSAEDVAALKALSAEVAAAQAALAPLERGAAGLRARAAALDKAIEEAGGAPMKKQRALVETLKEVLALLHEPVFIMQQPVPTVVTCGCMQGRQASVHGHGWAETERFLTPMCYWCGLE